MSNQSHFISQIQEKEKDSLTMIESVEKENAKLISKAIEDSDNFVAEAESEARDLMKADLEKAKEDAKDEYKRMIVDGDNSRRDIVEKGKVNIEKGKKYVMDAFISSFK
ncbi:hypothetical protein JW758_01900 [Candidatus Peregrinibacteria bacterium]|nr:hypothetical protein [Candidatus Peregrinibacteria bacterium]